MISIRQLISCTGRLPPVHSVTFPSHFYVHPTGIRSLTSTTKKCCTSLRTLANGLVLKPLFDLIVLPCMGSHDQTTLRPSSLTDLIKPGKNLSILSAPNALSVIYLDHYSESLSIGLIKSEPSNVGPHFKPKGF